MYSDHFQHADDVIAHLDTIVPDLPDALLRAKYVGFVTVAAVTVYELAVKSIFIEFGAQQHKVFGAFTAAYFDRINGRVRLCHIRDDYIRMFGQDYRTRFDENLAAISKEYLHLLKRDIANSYANLITWRNDFAHEGRLAEHATYEEVVQAYVDGKEVIRCLAETMK